jgi:hypothetical protein
MGRHEAEPGEYEYFGAGEEDERRRRAVSRRSVSILRIELTAVRDPTLGALDARFMMTGAETALLMARKMRMDNNAFNVDEYLIRYVLFAG